MTSPWIDSLTPKEAENVLSRLWEHHPDWRPQIEREAANLLSEVSPGELADRVEFALGSIELRNLGKLINDQPGQRPTEPSEGAWRVLTEIFHPFLQSLLRAMELQQAEAATRTARGIIIGLSRLQSPADDRLISWADEFPEEAASQVLATLLSGKLSYGGTITRRDQSIPIPAPWQSWLEETLPHWKDSLINIALELRWADGDDFNARQSERKFTGGKQSGQQLGFAAGRGGEPSQAHCFRGRFDHADPRQGRK